MRRNAGFTLCTLFVVLVSLGAAAQLWAQVTAAPSPVTFAPVAVGLPAGSTQSVSFTISGVTLGGVSALTGGAANLDFTIAGGTCTDGSTGSCTVLVQFVPSTVGPRLGALVLTDQSTPPNTLIAVPLYGAGTGPLVVFGPGTIATMAGGNGSGYGGDSGPATEAQLNNPNGVAVDEAGNVYIADSSNNAIRKVTPGGIISTVASGFNYPATVRVDGAGNLYVADYYNNVIRMVTPGGVSAIFAGGGSGCGQQTDGLGDGCPATSAILNGPWGTVADGAGNLYIGDAGHNVIRKVGPDGTITTIAGTGVAGYSGDGLAATAAQLNAPQLGAMDGAGNLYFADYYNNVIRKITPGGMITTVAGDNAKGPGYSGDGGPATLAQFYYPQEVAVDAAGDLYIADSGNSSYVGQGYGLIRKVTPGGIISTVAGNGTQGYSGDGGPATSAQLYGPWDIAVDGLGNLYIADAYNNAIRKVDVSGAPSLGFANTYYNTNSAAQDVAVLNLGTAPLTINTISASVNFSLGGPDTSCSFSNQALNPAASCVLGIEFSPATVGGIIGSVKLTDTSLNATTATQSIALSGTGLQAAQTITFAGPGNQTYGVAPIALTATASSTLPVSFVYVSGPASLSGSALTITGAGAVTVQAIQVGNTDYAAAAPVNVTFTVGQAPLTVTVAPGSYSRAVGAANPGFTGTVVGVVNNDLAQNRLVVTYSSTAVAGSPIGSYPVTATLSGAAAASYNLTVVPGILSVWAQGVDLIESVVSGPAAGASGAVVQVTDTVKNQGILNAGGSTTGFYISADGVTKGTYLGYRYVGTLSVGASAGPVTTTLTLPVNLNGTYYVMACANYNGGIAESNTVNNCTPTAAFAVTGADLVENGVSLLTTAPQSGGSVQVSDTVLNQGGGTAATSTTGFYLSTNGVTKGTYLGYRYVGGLGPNVTSTAATALTLPANLLGTYYVIACANYNGGMVESNTANDCTPTAAFAVAGADLVESSVSLLTTAPQSGGSVQVSDTVLNQGGGNAAASTTGFYLSTNGTTKTTYLGYRYVGGLGANATSAATTTLTLPANLAGTYYVIACANYNNGIVESNTANNCTASLAFAIIGADMTVASVGTNPSAVLPGGTLAITDTTADALVNANASTTRYYLSTSTNLVKTGSGAAVILGARSIPALAASTASTGTVNTTVAASTAAGTYYVFACANDTNSVAESNLNNNCTATPVAVYTAANTVFVDQANANASNSKCGTSAIPCITITEGLTTAKAGQTVLVNSGSYSEQLTITQNVTLASALKNTAVVQAPPVLTADANGLTTLLEVGGGATSVAIVNMGVRGPGPAEALLNYGVYVTSANATIVGNQVQSIRDATYSGGQHGIAIRFGSQASGFVGHTGSIAYNTVGDYQKGGIVVDGAGTNVNVLGNLVTGQNQTLINGQNGIQMSRGALGLVNNNTVSDNIYANPATPLNVSADGILLYDITGGVTVGNNTVTGNDEGIGIYSDATAATNAVVENNTANENAVLGIHVDANSRPTPSGRTRPKAMACTTWQTNIRT